MKLINQGSQILASKCTRICSKVGIDLSKNSYNDAHLRDFHFMGLEEKGERKRRIGEVIENVRAECLRENEEKERGKKEGGR